MGKLLLIGAAVLIAFLLLSLVLAPSDTAATTEPSDTKSSETIQDITADMRNRFDSFQSETSENISHTPESPQHETKKQTSRRYTFASGTDKQYTFTVTPEIVPYLLQVTYHPSMETYKKGYTDSFTKKWTETTRTVYSPHSRAEITISDQSGRVISTLGFGGTYSTELTSKTTLRSQEKYTFIITGNHISLDLSSPYP